MTRNAELAYLFRHSTLRDGAYQLHIPSDRAELHEIALSILETMLPEDDRITAALDLAAHARQAQHGRTLLSDDLPKKELGYLKAAAKHAKSKYQNAEAARHYTTVANHPNCRPVDASRMLTQAAYLHWFAGERDQCEAAFEQALKLAGMDRNARCDVLIERGTYYRDLGQHGRAKNDLMQAKKLAEALGDKSLQLRSTGNLNTVLDRNIGGEAAEKLYAPLKELARELNNFSAVGISMGQIGHAYFFEKNYDKAALWLERSIEELGRTNDGLNEAVMGITLGRVLMQRKSADDRNLIHRALELFRKSVTRAKDVGNRPFRVSGYIGMADCYRKLEMPLEAETYARRGLAIAAEIRHERSLGSAYVALGLVLEARNAISSAEQNYLHGLDSVQEFADRSQAVVILYALARLAASQDDWAAAENYILTARDQPLDSSETELIEKLSIGVDCILQRKVPLE